MSRETERAAITEFFASVYPTSAGPVAYPNHDFTTPVNSRFTVFDLVDRGTSRDSIGRTYLKRARGSVQIDLYTPANLGVRDSRLTAQTLEDAFDSKILTTTDGEVIIFYTASSRTLAANEMRAANLDDQWSRYIVEIPYTRQINFTPTS